MKVLHEITSARLKQGKKIEVRVFSPPVGDWGVPVPQLPRERGNCSDNPGRSAAPHRMPACQQRTHLSKMSPTKSPAPIAIPSHGSQGGLSNASSGSGSFTRRGPESLPEMSSASTNSGGSNQSLDAFQDEYDQSGDDSSDSNDYDHLLSAYRSQIAVMAQTKPKGRSKPRADRSSGCDALVNAAAAGVDAQWKVAPLAAAELRKHWAAAEAKEAPQQAAFVPVESDKHLQAVLAAAVPQLKAHWAAPQALPKAHTAAEDAHLKAVVDRAVREIKAHWAAAEAPAPEATPGRKQVSEKDHAAVLFKLVAESWAMLGGRHTETAAVS